MLPTRIRNTINSLPLCLASMSESRLVWLTQRYPAPITENFFLLYYTCDSVQLHLNNSSFFSVLPGWLTPFLFKKGKRKLFYRYRDTFFLINVRLVTLGTVQFPSGEFRFAHSILYVDLIFNFDVMLSSLCPSSWAPTQYGL